MLALGIPCIKVTFGKSLVEILPALSIFNVSVLTLYNEGKAISSVSIECSLFNSSFNVQSKVQVSVKVCNRTVTSPEKVPESCQHEVHRCVQQLVWSSFRRMQIYSCIYSFWVM